MADAGPTAISIADAMSTLEFFAGRTPTTTDDEAADAFAQLSTYRDGGIFVGHWAGNSEWERHPADEIVMAIAGSTTIYFLTDDGERSAALRSGQLVVVPAGTWHRFETPEELQLLSVTPQPTDHRPDRPD